MKTVLKELLIKTTKALIAEGEEVKKTQHSPDEIHAFVNSQEFHKWLGGCRNLMRMLGKYSESWISNFETADRSVYHCDEMIGTLQSIKEAIEHDLLVEMDVIVMAEAFDNLLEQATYLLSEGYFIAAGVLGRAVLEEHLRRWCDKDNCLPAKPRPTLNDYATALYTTKRVIDKIQWKHVEAMAAIGNDSAHATGKASKEDVERLLRDVREFLARNPV